METLPSLLPPITLFFLFVAAFLAGLVDSIAGGGGLIALPALIFSGLPPQLALGTNKLQGSFGTLSATINYVRKGQVSLKQAIFGVMCTFIGAASGSWLVQQLHVDFIRPLIPIMLMIVFIYTLFSGKLGFEDRKARLPSALFWLLAGLSLGFYDGFFGPGTGSFWTAGLMIFLGYNMVRASGYTKIMNFTSNVVALSLFMVGGNVCYSAGLVMAVGQVLGASLGSSLAIKKGAGFIRPVFLTVVFLTIVRLVFQNC